jgi:hypothetical protein
MFQFDPYNYIFYMSTLMAFPVHMDKGQLPNRVAIAVFSNFFDHNSEQTYFTFGSVCY